MYRQPSKDSPVDAACVVDSAVFTIATQSSHTRNVGIQLKDADGSNLKQVGAVDAYLSDNSDGSTLIGTAPSSTVAIGTDGLLINQVTDKAFKLVSESNGHIDINLINSTAKDIYIVLIMPDGGIQVSAKVAIA